MSNQSYYHRILTAVDFSACSAAALKQAIWLARRIPAGLTLTHVIPNYGQSGYSESLSTIIDQQNLKSTAEAAMRRMIVDLNAMDLEITYQVLTGEPYLQVTNAVQNENYNLVLAGTHGPGPWEQFLVGSTAKRLIRNCPGSIWIAKAEHLVPPQVVLAATDFSGVSLRAAREGLQTAMLSGAAFHLLHVVDSEDVPEDLISNIPQGSSFLQEINNAAARRLEEFKASLTTEGVEISCHLAWGKPWQEIRRIAKHQAADLVVIGTVGRSGIKGLLVGNTAEKVLNSCDCSILTVKPPDFVSPVAIARS